MAATIKDIATIAGVSRGTVDRVLNNRGKVSPKVAERVLKAAHTLQYKPNAAAKVMATLRMKLLFGIMLPGKDNAFFVELLEGLNKAKEELEDMRVETIVREIQRYDVDHYLELMDELLHAGITALALFPLDDVRIAAKIDEIVTRGIPVVTVTSDLVNSKRNCYVGADFVKSGQLAAGLVGLMNDNAHVLILSGSEKVLSHKQRVKGFCETIKKRFPQVEIEKIIKSNDDEYYVYDIVEQTLKENSTIDVMIVVDGSVQGACEALTKFPGRNMRTVCFDDIPKVVKLLENNQVCATVSQQTREQGYTVMNCLFNYFTGAMTDEPKEILLNNIVMIRENFFSP